jgi:hypothetical protein
MIGCYCTATLLIIILFMVSMATWAEGIRGLMGEKGLMEEDWMTEATGGRRYYNCQMGTGRCGNIVQPAKQQQ